jgi:hypothetical protein
MATRNQITTWAAALQTKLQEAYRKAQYSGTPTVEVQFGPKYARIVRIDGSSTSAYAFVEGATGNIFKSESWKKPAKHARGNIGDADPLACCEVFSVRYLR